jgi:hypothetical protein
MVLMGRVVNNDPLMKSQLLPFLELRSAYFTNLGYFVRYGLAQG